MAPPQGVFAGRELRGMREEAGLTQSEVARAWGRPQSNLSEIERNERRVSLEQKALIAATIKHLAKEKAAA